MADDAWRKLCGRMLVKLWKQKEVWPFCEPVDYAKEGIPSYPEVIKNPMDLGTVKLKLTNGNYSNAEAFADDVSFPNHTLPFTGMPRAFELLIC
jgi:bromodomain-containing factor 1